MPHRLPKANTNFKQKQATLYNTATNVYNSMNGNPEFPTPPITMITFVGFINTYSTSLSTAIKGSKEDTAAKNQAKTNLINAMRVLAQYVTQTAYNLYTTQSSAAQIANMKRVILSSGFELQKTATPVADGIGIELPRINKLISKSPTTLSILLRNYTRVKKGIKTYQVRFRTSEIPAVSPAVPIPEGSWNYVTLTSGNMKIEGLLSEFAYDVQIAGIGGNNTKLNAQNPVNWTPIRKVWIT